MKAIDFTKNYLSELGISIKQLHLEAILNMTKILLEAYEKGKQIFVMGNGGSAATASHFVCDLRNIRNGKKRFNVVGLCDNVAILTANANDYGYKNTFKEQIRQLVRENDVVIAVSASGNSENIIAAVEFAGAHSAITVGLTGFDGGKLKKIVTECLTVPSTNTEHIEDIHLIIFHLMKLWLCKSI